MSSDVRQQQAIETTGTNILVSASAGAGKTRVLIERMIKRCLVDHVEMNELLAVTFTEAAAGEMKNRAAVRLQEELDAAADSEKREYIERQLVLLENAWITTIDSMCVKIIQKYYNVIGLDPACVNHILDDSSREDYLRRAFFHSLKQYEQNHHEELVRCLVYTSARSESYEELLKIVNEVIVHASNQPDPDEWFDKAAAFTSPAGSLSEFPREILDGFFQAMALKLEVIRSYTQSTMSFCETSEKLAGKEAEFTAVLNRLPLLTESIERRDYELFRFRFKQFADESALPPDSKNKQYTALRKKWSDTIKDIAEDLFPKEILIQDQQELAPITATILDLSRMTYHAFSDLKRSETCMDFADMERFAWNILIKNNHAVADIYRGTLKEVMVDEFQDTSILQNQIIEQIAPPGTIFRVGDVKQSIYRFRQAKPSLMRSLINDPATCHIVLEHNYRSSETIVNFCNILFQRLMNLPGCEDHYDENDIVTVGTEKQKTMSTEPVEFILLDTEFNDAEEEALEEKAAKAEWIASSIQRSVLAGHSYGEHAILVRSHHDKGILRLVFDRCGIPYDLDAREGFFQSDLCRNVLALLKLMVSPADELSLLTVLTSPVFAISDEELAEMKLRGGSVLGAAEEEMPQLFAELEELHTLSRTHGLPALLNALTRFHHFYEVISDKDRANFDFLYEKVISLQGLHTIYDLIDYMQSSENERSSQAVSNGRDDDLVTVTTIHQSKGLQYPIVYLWSTGLNPSMNGRQQILVDDELFLGLRHMDLKYRTRRNTLQRIALEYKDNLEDLEEFTRVLYVALTRAERKLYLVDTLNHVSAYTERLTLAVPDRRKGMTGLITAALQDIPSVFRYTILSPVTADISNVSVRKREKQLPVFHGKAHYLGALSRPSDTELADYLPGLNPDGSDNGSAYGTRMHEILEHLPNRKWTEEDFGSLQLSGREKQRLMAFCSSPLYEHCLTMTIHKEYPFYVEDRKQNRRLYGVIDFLAENGKEVLLIDFKTDYADEQELLKRYSAQINAYRDAVRILFPEKSISAWIWSLHAGKAVSVPSME